MLQTFHQLMDTAQGYGLAQLFGLPTIRRYQAFIRKYVPQGANRRVLEIGCGLGSARQFFSDDYTGVDINPDYIQKAQRKFSGRFHVMDAAEMSFAPNTFDDAVSIATTHHLSDGQLAAMVSKAASVASQLHIIDAILPVSPKSLFKRTLFRMDRGRFVRTFDQLRDIVIRNAHVDHHDIVEGPLHDVCYLRATRRHEGAGS